MPFRIKQISQLDALLAKFIIYTASENEQYAYHTMPADFSGKTIFSLENLKTHEPIAYKQALKKYKGREDWIRRKIPGLDCTAMDVVNLSTINPIKLFIIEILLNIENIDDKTIIKIPISSLKESDMVLFSYGEDLKYKYKKIQPHSYKECKDVPLDTAKYYIQSKINKDLPLTYEYVPHLLVKNSVDISDSEIIKFTQLNFEEYIKNL